MFYLPKILWEYFEKGKMDEMSKGVLVGHSMDKKYQETLDTVGQNVIKYIENPVGHKSYGWGYIAAQTANLCVVLLSFFMCDRLIDGKF